MNRPHHPKHFTAKCALILSALLCTSITDAASLIRDTIELDPVLVDGNSLLKFTLVTKDSCLKSDPLGFCDNGFQLHNGQKFTILSKQGNPIIEPGATNTVNAASFDNASATLTIPHLVDSEYRQASPSEPAKREVNATLILTSFVNAKTGTSTLVFTVTKLEELIKNPTDVGALQVFNGKDFELLPPGPEDAILSMRDGKPVWLKHYKIGDEGPHGGTVFFISDNGLHGLEAAPKGSAGALEVTLDPKTGEPIGGVLVAPWGCNDVNGANLANVGAGRQNTFDILSSCHLSKESKEAAAIAAKFKLSKDETCYFDVETPTVKDVCWYLPSSGELELMRQQNVLLKLVPGNIGTGKQPHIGKYWSSTERALALGDDNTVLDTTSPDAFSDQGFQKKDQTLNVRAIRDF